MSDRLRTLGLYPLNSASTEFGAFLLSFHKIRLKLLILSCRCSRNFKHHITPETGHNHLYGFPLVPIAKNKEINILFFFSDMHYCFIIYKFNYLGVICRFSL